MNLINRLYRQYPFKHQRRYKINNVLDTPENMLPNVIYIVGNRGYEWCIAMKCPCGCKCDIYLNLLPSGRPRWKFQHVKSKVTVIPSIWRIDGCRSHFFITKSKLKWCR